MITLCHSHPTPATTKVRVRAWDDISLATAIHPKSVYKFRLATQNINDNNNEPARQRGINLIISVVDR